MEVQLIKLNKIKVNDKNPRTITEDKLRRLIESILVFPKMLSIRPIVIDDKGVALGGNMRTRALKEIKKLGRDAIPERLQQIRQYANKPRCAETLIMDYRRQYGIDAKIVRIFNTYGERMREDDGRVMTNFITQALDNKDITIYGDGSQTRSFMYVSDLIDGLLLMMKSKTATICNLGNPDEKTIKELAEKVVHLTSSQSKIVFCKLPKDDPRRRCPDISRAKTLLAWSPKVTLDEGLQKMIRFYGERRKI